jgi:hypothetical protein
VSGIVCPVCGGDTRVAETRTTDGQVRRRRHCEVPGCDGRITTIEMAVYGPRRGLKLTGDAIMIPRGLLVHLKAARDEIDRALRTGDDE